MTSVLIRTLLAVRYVTHFHVGKTSRMESFKPFHEIPPTYMPTFRWGIRIFWLASKTPKRQTNIRCRGTNVNISSIGRPKKHIVLRPWRKNSILGLDRTRGNTKKADGPDWPPDRTSLLDEDGRIALSSLHAMVAERRPFLHPEWGDLAFSTRFEG